MSCRKKVALKLKTYTVVSDAVEQGVLYGIRRAHKYTDAPSDDLLLEQVREAVLSSLCEVVDFP